MARKKNANRNVNAPLCNLPTDILKLTFFFLSAEEKINVARTCKKLKSIAYDDILWKVECIEANIPIPENCTSYRELYKAENLNARIICYIVGTPTLVKYETRQNADMMIHEPRHVSKKEMLNSFPTKKTAEDVKVFMDFGSARAYGLSISKLYNEFLYDNCAAIFKIKFVKKYLKNEISEQITYEERGEPYRTITNTTVSYFSSPIALFSPKMILGAATCTKHEISEHKKKSCLIV